jgi:hypothetical protein
MFFGLVTMRSATAKDKINNPVAERSLLLRITAAITNALPSTTKTTMTVKTEIIVNIRKNPGCVGRCDQAWKEHSMEVSLETEDVQLSYITDILNIINFF